MDCLTKETQDDDSDEAREAVQKIMKDLVNEVVKSQNIDYVNISDDNNNESCLKDVNNDFMEVGKQDMSVNKDVSDEILKVSLVGMKQRV